LASTTVSNQSAIVMSQFESVKLSLKVEGECVKLTTEVFKRRPPLPRQPYNKELMEAGEFVIQRDPVTGKSRWIRM